MNPKKLASDVHYESGRLQALADHAQYLGSPELAGCIDSVSKSLTKIANKLLELPEVDDDT